MNTRKDVSSQASLNEVAESAAAKRDYDRAMEMLMSMSRSAKDKMIPVPALLVALVDFTTAFALAIGGDETLRLIVRRVIGRIDDWNEGMFTDAPPSTRLNDVSKALVAEAIPKDDSRSERDERDEERIRVN